MIIITEKPVRSIDVCGWYVDSYTDKSGERIYKLVGIVSPKSRGRLVSRDSTVVKDIYMDEENVVIYRSENYNNVVSCKRIMDLIASRGVSVFSLVTFYEWLKENNSKPENVKQEEAVNKNED